MQLSSQKLEIVSSVSSLNDSQTRTVLNFIRSLSDAGRTNPKTISRNEAMAQISQALDNRKLQQTF